MTFHARLTELLEKATKGPWFKRYCDDDNHMCMTVISSTNHGNANTGQFKDEPDTIAATFHQIAPVIGDTPDCNEATTDLIIYLVNHAEAIRDLVVAAEKVKDVKACRCLCDSCLLLTERFSDISEALAKLEEE